MLFAALVIGALFALTIEGTRLGLSARAVIMNETLARSLGIDTDRVRLATFMIGAGLAALAGVLLTPLTSVDPNMGVAWLIGAFMLVMVADTSYLALAVACLVFGGAASARQHLCQSRARRHFGRCAGRACAQDQSAGLLACLRTRPFSTVAPGDELHSSGGRRPRRPSRRALIVWIAPARARRLCRQRSHPVDDLRHPRGDRRPAVGFHRHSYVRPGCVLRRGRLRDRHDDDEPRLDAGLDGGGAGARHHPADGSRARRRLALLLSWFDAALRLGDLARVPDRGHAACLFRRPADRIEQRARRLRHSAARARGLLPAERPRHGRSDPGGLGLRPLGRRQAARRRARQRRPLRLSRS